MVYCNVEKSKRDQYNVRWIKRFQSCRKCQRKFGALYNVQLQCVSHEKCAIYCVLCVYVCVLYNVQCVVCCVFCVVYNVRCVVYDVQFV